MLMRKLASVGMFFAVVLSALIGAFCIEFFALPGAVEDKTRPPLSSLLPSVISADPVALVFDVPEVDLGAVKGSVKHRFSYRNSGTTPLTITRTRTSCRCTTSEPDRTTLQPQESGNITLEADISHKEPGAHRLLLFIEYEWEDHKATAIASLLVIHQPDLYITPSLLNITVAEGTRTTANITIIDYRKGALQLLKIRSSSPFLEAKISESPSEYLPGWRYVIEAAYTDSPKESRRHFSERILIDTSDPQASPLTIPVEVHRLGRLRIAPQSVALQSGQAAEVILRDSLGEKVAIAECDTAGLVDFSFNPDAETFKKISLSLPRGTEDLSKFPATIWIRVNKPCERRIPIIVSLAPSKGR
jgi:hypothetical protein